MPWHWGFAAYGERAANRPERRPKVDRGKVKAGRRAARAGRRRRS